MFGRFRGIDRLDDALGDPLALLRLGPLLGLDILFGMLGHAVANKGQKSAEGEEDDGRKARDQADQRDHRTGDDEGPGRSGQFAEDVLAKVARIVG